jgi:hypothetical protein
MLTYGLNLVTTVLSSLKGKKSVIVTVIAIAFKKNLAVVLDARTNFTIEYDRPIRK